MTRHLSLILSAAALQATKSGGSLRAGTGALVVLPLDGGPFQWLVIAFVVFIAGTVYRRYAERRDKVKLLDALHRWQIRNRPAEPSLPSCPVEAEHKTTDSVPTA